MGKHLATILWSRSGATFSDNRYSRGHRWQFDGGMEVAASASPHVVPKPHSVEEAVDPEEAFVASLSSCHMLWFLSIAVQHGFVVDSYRDEAVGVMAKNAAGKIVMTHVTLRPQVLYEGLQPDVDQERAMHHKAHEECYLANSVKTEVLCEPVIRPSSS